MFCYKCGLQIPDDARFCSKCGTEQKVNISIGVTEKSGEYSNEALKIYFTDLLTLECINNKLEQKLSLLEFEIKTMEDSNFCQHYCLLEGLRGWYLHLRYDGEEVKFAAFDVERAGGFTRGHPRVGKYEIDIEDLNWNPNHRFHVWFSVEKNRELFETAWQSREYTLFGSERAKTDRKLKEKVLNFLSEFQKNAPIEYQKNSIEINKQKQKLNEMKKEFEQARDLLQRAYDVNIVPKQFRNLYAVYYLTDFINTSNESLSTALLNYNLEIIKEKLDNIIEQQQEIIINQALTMAQNEKIMKQNEQQLRHLASIEQNTDRAAQYAQIASNNAEACAWIGIANYISK